GRAPGYAGPESVGPVGHPVDGDRTEDLPMERRPVRAAGRQSDADVPGADAGRLPGRGGGVRASGMVLGPTVVAVTNAVLEVWQRRLDRAGQSGNGITSAGPGTAPG